MLKKLLITTVLTLGVLGMNAQTIVSTSPENRNVILEEFTGIHCVYCPSGHQIAQGIKDDNPDDVFLINIHAGGYAVPGNNEPDFRTPYGQALANQSGLIGYPAGTVNRQNFPGKEQGAPGSTALSRNYWASTANEVLSDGSYLNMAVTAQIESATNVMTIHVEGYYTGDSPESTNLLNIAIVQNNTTGPQTGGGQGSNYNHMHRLIDMVTGQWGEEITQTTEGTFIERDYTYPIPPHNNFVPVEIGELEVVVFMTETHQGIISGNGTTPVVTTTHNNDGNVRYIEDFKATCLGNDATITPRVNIQNAGSDPISSLDIDYTMNGVAATYSWSGNLPSLTSETITLPEITFTTEATNSFEVSIPNDDYNDSNSKSYSFNQSPMGTGVVNMELVTDSYGSECRWNLKDSAGNIVYNGGPYGNGVTINEEFILSEDCYSFQIIDTYGDGGASVTLTDNEGNELYVTDGNYGSGEISDFSSNGVLGVNQTQMDAISLYPNPATSTINLKNAENANVQVFDVLGKMLFSVNNISTNEQVDVAKLHSGTYFMKITKNNKVITKRFLVSK
ncbi:T9SS type A sorting domain-containing protein [Aequorivita marina]|uniref:T9SS type A sorting domain-containing protein n=1 Tax=Aequorivita marina TaxID=3073654 RepID=UPI002874A532|nr:T9SS type A sorting domain-containing protein [Aequorivita sp. S2608]MDS1298253.1 T9SS type A sorting domain-containing protein [Aequorivita sp. S2608]